MLLPLLMTDDVSSGLIETLPLVDALVHPSQTKSRRTCPARLKASMASRRVTPIIFAPFTSNNLIPTFNNLNLNQINFIIDLNKFKFTFKRPSLAMAPPRITFETNIPES